MTYAANAIAQINRVTNLTELAILADSVTTAINGQIAAVAAQTALVAPIAALATVSVTDLPSVLTFVGSLKTAVMGPAAGSAVTLAAQAAVLTTDLAAVLAAIVAAEIRLAGTPSPPTPPPPPPPPPPLPPISAALIAYLPAGPGAVAITVQDKLRETVSLRDFGAAGDRTTDDTVAVQNALDYCSAQGARLNIPRGFYRVTTALTATLPPAGSFANPAGGAQMTIEGDGSANTEFFYTGSTSDDVLTITGNAPPTDRLVISGLRITRADGSPGSVGTGAGLTLNNISSFSLSDILLFRHGVGLHAVGCVVGEFNNFNCEYNDMHVRLEKGSFASFPNQLAFNNSSFLAAYSSGLRCDGGVGLQLYGCNFEGNGVYPGTGKALHIVSSGSDGGVAISFVGVNYFENNAGYDVYIEHPNANCVYDLRNAIFNRVSSARYTTSNIVIYAPTLGPGAGPALLDVSNSAFLAFNSYSRNSGRPTILLDLDAGYDGMTIKAEGATGLDQVDAPVYSAKTILLTAVTRIGAKAKVSGAGALASGYGVTVAKVGTGLYEVTLLRSDANACNVATGIGSNVTATVKTEAAPVITVETRVGGSVADAAFNFISS